MANETMADFNSSIRTIRIPSWALALMGVFGALLGFAILMLGAGLLLVIVPVIVIGGLIARWRLNKRMRQAYEQSRRDGEPQVIEGEFKVLNERKGRRRFFDHS